MDISGKSIVVTGASQGIGVALCRLLTEYGARVGLVARSGAALIALEKELPGAIALPADLRNPAEADGVIQQAFRRFGRIDVLVNNAGQGMWRSVEQTDIDEYKSLMELNVFAALRLMQAVIPVMRQQSGGLIVNVSSAVTTMYLPNLGAYSSTKYALNALSAIARQELAPDNIRVSLMLPKLTDTGFGAHAIRPEPEAMRDWNNPRRPPMDTPEAVAEKITGLIVSEAPEAKM